MSARDTIFALSSGALPSGVAVLRLSGPSTGTVVASLAGSLPEPRKAVLRWICGRGGERLDQALVIWFPAPGSFTGEDCAEFHVHGGRAVVAAVLAALGSFEGMRLSEPGEFSRRAFDNGKLDLVEVEGLADLIAAETEMQRRLAVEQSSGRLSALYQGWAETLTRTRALIEAELDFPDEEDVPGAVSDQVWPILRQLREEMNRHVRGLEASEIVRDGFRVAIVGPPNAGKSSLLNALARRDVAIVTDVAGTTRDVLGVDLDIGGYLVHLMDTAGIREADDLVEREGVRRTLKTVDEADLILHLMDPLSRSDVEFAAGKSVLAVHSKADLLEATPPAESDDLYVSALTGVGLDSLTKRIAAELERRIPASGLAPARRRQADYVTRAIADLGNALAEGADLELRAEYLRLSAHSLGKITGQVSTEDLLEVIFSEFCIGK